MYATEQYFSYTGVCHWADSEYMHAQGACVSIPALQVKWERKLANRGSNLRPTVYCGLWQNIIYEE